MKSGVSIIIPNKYDDLWEKFLEMFMVHDPGYPNEILRVDGTGENFSFAKACNTGTDKAKYEYVCYMNDDLYPKTDLWLYKMVSVLKVNNLSAVNPLQMLGDYFCYPEIEIPTMLVGPSYEVKSLSGFCLLTKKEYVVSIGGWDENFEHYYEDTDLSIRLHKFGLQAMVGGVYFHHVEKQSSSRELSKYKDKIKRSDEYFRKKWKIPPEYKNSNYKD